MDAQSPDFTGDLDDLSPDVLDAALRQYDTSSESEPVASSSIQSHAELDRYQQEHVLGM